MKKTGIRERWIWIAICVALTARILVEKNGYDDRETGAVSNEVSARKEHQNTKPVEKHSSNTAISARLSSLLNACAGEVALPTEYGAAKLLVGFADLAHDAPLEAIAFAESNRDHPLIVRFCEVLAMEVPVDYADQCLAAFQRLGAERIGSGQTKGILFARAWKAKGIDEATALFPSLNTEGLRQIKMMAFVHYAESSPEVALNYFNRHARGDDRKAMLSIIAGAFARADYENGIRWIHTLDPENSTLARSAFIRAAMWADPLNALRTAIHWGTEPSQLPAAELSSRLAAVNPTQLRAFLNEHMNLPMIQELLPGVLRQLSNAEPLMASELLKSIPDPVVRSQAGQAVFRNWLKVDSAAAVNWLESQDATQATAVLSSAGTIEALAREVPQAAAALLARVSPNGMALPAIKTIGANMAASDPVAAANWCRSFSQAEASSAAVEGAVRGLAVKSPGSALEFALQMPEDSPARTAGIRSVALLAGGKIIESNPAQVSSLAPNDRATFNDLVSEVYAWSNLPADVAKRVQLTLNRTQDEMQTRAELQRWMGQNPAAASRWLAEQPSGEWRVTSGRTVVDFYLKQDAQAAAQWVSDLPTGELKAESSIVIAQSLLDSDPQNAYAWAEMAVGSPRQQEIMEAAMSRLRPPPGNDGDHPPGSQ